MAKVAIYVRKSRANEGMAEKETLENQLNTVLHIAKKKKYDYEIFNEGVASSQNPERPQLNRMLKEIEKGKYNRILCTNTDRLWKDSDEAFLLYMKLGKYNVLIETEDGIFDPSDKMQKLMGYFKAHMDEEEYQKTRFRMAAGRISRVRSKKHMGNVPYGYRKDKNTDQLYIVEEEAELIRKAHELYQSGMSMYRLTQYFSDIGIRSGEGKAFRDSTIRNFLTNKAYIGIYTLHSTVLKETVTIRDSYPSILDVATFEKTQAKIVDNTTKDRRNHMPPKTPLDKLVYCGQCDGALQIHERKVTNKSGETSTYYSIGNCRRLVGEEKDKRCGNSSVSIKKILPLVYAELRKHRYGLQKALEKMESNDYKAELDKLEDKKKELQKKLQGLEDQKGVIMEMVKKQIIPISEYEQERKKIEKNVEETELEYDSVSLQIENFNIEDKKANIEYTMETIDCLQILPFKEQNDFLKSIIDRILLTNKDDEKEMEIIYY